MAELVNKIVLKVLPPFLKREGVWKFVSGAVLGFCLKHTLDRNKKPDAAPRRVENARVPPPAEEIKMVLCVNESLKMGKGKIGAQCAHAATGVVAKYRHLNEVLFRQWEYCGQAKIALKVQDENEMKELAEQAYEAGVPLYIVQDAGRTQIPAGSRTVLAIGPGPCSVINEITGSLRLL